MAPVKSAPQQPSPPAGFDWSTASGFLSPLGSFLAAAGAATTIRGTILKRLARVRDIRQGDATLGKGFAVLYEGPQYLNMALAGVVTLLGFALAALMITGQAGLVTKIAPYLTNFHPMWLVAALLLTLPIIWWDVITNVPIRIMQVALLAARMFGYRGPDPIALEHARTLLFWDENAQPVALRPAIITQIAGDAINRAASIDDSARAPMSNSLAEQRANLAMIGCCFENFMRRDLPEWRNFYSALDDANLSSEFAKPETLAKWPDGQSLQKRVRGEVDAKLKAKGLNTLPNEGENEIENGLRQMVNALKQFGGNAEGIAGNPHYPSVANARAWLQKHPQILGTRGMPAQFVKLAHRWGIWKNAELGWFAFPNSLDLAALLLERGALSPMPEAMALDFGREYHAKVLGASQLAIVEAADKWLSNNEQSDVAIALNTRYKNLLDRDRKWRLADDIDTAVWSLARENSKITDRQWSVANDRVIKRK